MEELRKDEVEVVTVEDLPATEESGKEHSVGDALIGAGVTLGVLGAIKIATKIRKAVKAKKKADETEKVSLKDKLTKKVKKQKPVNEDVFEDDNIEETEEE